MRSASQPASRMPTRFSTDRKPKALAEVVGLNPHSTAYGTKCVSITPMLVNPQMKNPQKRRWNTGLRTR